MELFLNTYQHHLYWDFAIIFNCWDYARFRIDAQNIRPQSISAHPLIFAGGHVLTQKGPSYAYGSRNTVTGQIIQEMETF